MDCGTRISKIPVMIQPSASVSFNSSSDTICPNMQVHFIDNSSINSGSIISRQWSWDDGNILPGNNTEVDYTFINEGINNTQLKVTTDKGCETTENLTITVISNPEAAFTVYRNCISDTVQISNTSNGIGLNSWQWDFGTSPLMVENANSPVPIVLYESDGTFPVQLILSNRFGCIDTLQHSISIHQNPTASFTYPLLCEQTEIKFIDNSIVADASFTDYSWLVSHHTFPEAKYSGTSPIIRFLDDDTFEIIHKVTDEFGCSDTVIRNVSVNNRPMTEFSITEVGGANSGELIFINQSVDVEKYFWDFGNEIISSLQSPTIKYENEGDYLISLIGYSNEGCADTAFLLYPYSIPDLLFPNAFTPGTDNLNSTFLPALPRKSLEPYTFQIYNRLGQMLFETHDPFRGWNGEFNNQACPAGVYTWVAKFMKTEKENKKPSIKRGMVTLIR
jgi:gliding motility-associated-like protein